MCNNSKSPFSLKNYNYIYMTSELKPLVERHLKRFLNLSVIGFKIVSRENNTAIILVLTNIYTLWSFTYTFLNPEKWPAHELQSSAKLMDAHEHRSLRNHYIESQGMSEIQASKACLEFFEKSNTFVEKETDCNPNGKPG